MKRYVGLIRHAPTAWNLEKRLQGRRDIPLDGGGRAWAGELAQSLAGLGFDRVVTSPLARAVETGRIISHRLGLPLEQAHGFIEADFGDWEGRTFREIAREDPGALDADKVAGWGFRPPGGESRLEVLSRAAKALADSSTRFPGEKLLVVTHKTLMKILVYRVMGWEFKPRGREKIRSDCLQLMAPDLSRARPDFLALGNHPVAEL